MRRQQADNHPANEENHPADEAVLLWPAVAEVTTARVDTITRFARGLTDLEAHRRMHVFLRDKSTRPSQAAVDGTQTPGFDWDDLGLPERRRAIQRQIRITVKPTRRNDRFDPTRIIVQAHSGLAHDDEVLD